MKINVLILSMLSLSVCANATDFPTDAALSKEMNDAQKFTQNEWKQAQIKAETQRKLIEQVDPQPNNFPNINVQNNNGIDIAALAERYKKRAAAQKNVDAVFAFASFSMPEVSLKKLVTDVAKVGGVVVFRGFIDDDFKKTLQKISELKLNAASIQINPKAYKQYKVNAVPSVVIMKPNTGEKLDLEGCALPENHSKVTGDVSLQFALEQIQEKEDKELSQIANRYLTLLKGKN